MAELYLIANGASPTTAALVPVTTGTAIKTMLQVKMGTTATRGKVVEWGISFEGFAAALPIRCELIETGTVFATVTRPLDVQFIAPTNQYVKQWPLGREPIISQLNYLRIRVTAAAAVNAYCYVIVE